MEIKELIREEGFICSCGKHHHTEVKDVIIGHGVLDQIPEQIIKHGGSKPFLLADQNTYRAAGERIVTILKENNIPFSCFIYPQEHLEPDEVSLGQAAMNFDTECNIIIGIGSGTINDLGKMLARVANRKYMFAGTAPSMDGYATNNSSMISAGVKVTLPSTCPTTIIADLDVICNAPMKMLYAGLGDMLAKYVSSCEWRISHLINGEYYCEQIASLVRRSLKKCIQAAEGLPKRDPKAIQSIMEGLVLSGIAIDFAGFSRPASGVEHYFSHVWDMRALVFQTNSDLHGIQVGIGTVLALGVYEQLASIQPDKNRALEYVDQFELESHQAFLHQFLGSSASELALLEQKEGKYDKRKHALRLEQILQHWDDILAAIQQELPEQSEIVELLEEIGAPSSPAALGFSTELVRRTFHATKDIRDKYSVSRLLWDIGELDAFFLD
ncbi:MAG TPA: sn-glycerol-1-phosphate dehydrogenase [Clostridiales bacterium]|nr:sn-glycerol-1-phosphate dehydrogenase [Clostridiales bacterium]